MEENTSDTIAEHDVVRYAANQRKDFVGENGWKSIVKVNYDYIRKPKHTLQLIAPDGNSVSIFPRWFMLKQIMLVFVAYLLLGVLPLYAYVFYQARSAGLVANIRASFGTMALEQIQAVFVVGAAVFFCGTVCDSSHRRRVSIGSSLQGRMVPFRSESIHRIQSDRDESCGPHRALDRLHLSPSCPVQERSSSISSVDRRCCSMCFVGHPVLPCSTSLEATSS